MKEKVRRKSEKYGSEAHPRIHIFHDKMIKSFSANFRAKVIIAALKGFRRQCEAADSGTGPPLFRPRSYVREKRRNKKLRIKESWYRPYHDVVGFVPPSPGGELLAGLQKIATEEERKIGIKIKLVEQSGTSGLKRVKFEM